MFKYKAKIVPEIKNLWASRALDPSQKDFALRARDARSARKNTFFHLKICFFKLNNTFFESDRLAALVFGGSND